MNGVQTQHTPKGISAGLLRVFLVLAAFGLPTSALAAEMPFLGETITLAAGKYLVKKDVNVRSIPKTSGKRVDGLKKGEIVRVVGRSG